MSESRRSSDFHRLSCIEHMSGRLYWLVWLSQTSAVRMWFAVASIGFASFMLMGNTVHNIDSEYRFMLRLADHKVWAFLFALHGLSLLYGVLTRVFNPLLLVLEGVLGTIIWVAAAVAMTFAQNAPGATVAGALIAAWICIRYPTIQEKQND